MTQDLINYPTLIDNAMRGVIRDVLRLVKKNGLPGEHHFYISYDTSYPGVKMSEQLKARYPKEITIVLQHQYWDFKVEDGFFQVTLSFGGVPEKLIVPYAAMTAFADPSIKFGLQFQPPDMSDAVAPVPAAKVNTAKADTAKDNEVTDSEDGAGDDNGTDKIISLDHFRKK